MVLLDFESAAIGPREWDLMPTAIAVAHYGRTEGQYREFTAAYGFDVRIWEGYPVLREIREMTMTTWLMQKCRRGPGHNKPNSRCGSPHCGRKTSRVPGTSTDPEPPPEDSEAA